MSTIKKLMLASAASGEPYWALRATKTGENYAGGGSWSLNDYTYPSWTVQNGALSAQVNTLDGTINWNYYTKGIKEFREIGQTVFWPPTIYLPQSDDFGIICGGFDGGTDGQAISGTTRQLGFYDRNLTTTDNRNWTFGYNGYDSYGQMVPYLIDSDATFEYYMVGFGANFAGQLRGGAAIFSLSKNNRYPTYIAPNRVLYGSYTGSSTYKYAFKNPNTANSLYVLLETGVASPGYTRTVIGTFTTTNITGNGWLTPTGQQVYRAGKTSGNDRFYGGTQQNGNLNLLCLADQDNGYYIHVLDQSSNLAPATDSVLIPGSFPTIGNKTIKSLSMDSVGNAYVAGDDIVGKINMSTGSWEWLAGITNPVSGQTTNGIHLNVVNDDSIMLCYAGRSISSGAGGRSEGYLVKLPTDGSFIGNSAYYHNNFQYNDYSAYTNTLTTFTPTVATASTQWTGQSMDANNQGNFSVNPSTSYPTSIATTTIG